ncbi:hypothetical protein [Garciella nitratireducens]|uniref:Uncharacterized protein n=1 Tax=Garciella nitratireducens DSM 15102 TaxID=1121911 RepID=A0A1T4LLZ5_9FIRM|nr:hypothetical protein [Garciella nitratireducens]RBP46864.1 hypothetical protein DFR81_101271 [Garciella nitratireducens]SJZ55617.1 hypothetical protein SAMN02745973_01026 [Garciella nitratireducens DSM 15102]
MDLGLTLLVIGIVLVLGAKIFSKIIKWVSFLTIKILGLIVVIIGILFLFE